MVVPGDHLSRCHLEFVPSATTKVILLLIRKKGRGNGLFCCLDTMARYMYATRAPMIPTLAESGPAVNGRYGHMVYTEFRLVP